MTMKYIMLMVLLFCTVTSGIAQNAKDLQLSANISESGCAGNLHIVAVEALGGQAPYKYTWSDGRTGSFRNDIKGGTYTCTVLDSSGKVAKKTFQLPQLPAELTANARQEKSADKVVVHIEARGGVGPYTYTWFGNGIKPEQSGNSIKQLEAGHYQVVVLDSKGCNTMIKVSIDQ